VKVSQEELGASFKLLQKNAADAVSGMNKDAADGFHAIGISTEWLKEHLGDTEGLFLAVRDHLRELTTEQDRAAESQRILGRSGDGLIPMFEMTDDRVNGLIDTFKKLNSTEDDLSAADAQLWQTLSVEIEKAWEGVKKELAEPILQYVAAHSKELQTEIISLADTLRADLQPAVQWMTADGGVNLANAFKDIEPAIKDAVIVGEDFIKVLDSIAAHNEILEAVGGVAAIVGGATGNLPLLALGVGAVYAGEKIGEIRDERATYPTPVTVNNQMLFDPDAAASETMRQLTPAMKKAHAQTRER
jgi:hypothetical protein